MHPKSFVRRAPPGPAGGAYSAPPDPLTGFKRLLLRKGRGGREGERMGGERREGEGRRSGLPLHIISGYAIAPLSAHNHTVSLRVLDKD